MERVFGVGLDQGFSGGHSCRVPEVAQPWSPVPAEGSGLECPAQGMAGKQRPVER